MILSNTDRGLRAAWHVVATSAEVRTEPVPVRLLGESWVLVRLPDPDGDGDATTLAAFVDRCPHRWAPLSAGAVDAGVLRCAYHGWCFGPDGSCTEIPSLAAGDRRPSRARATTPAAVTERGGLVFLAPEPPCADLLEMDATDDPAFMHGALQPVRARVGAALMIDNFLDHAHFPFVHAATIGSEEATEVGELSVEREGFGMTVRSRHRFPNHEDRGVSRGERALLQERVLNYEYRAPFSVSLRIDYVEAGGTNVIHFFVQPETDDSCRVYTLLHRNDLDDDPHQLAECVAFEAKVLDEDLALQERFVELGLPLDPTAEVHVRADRPGVELRRILADLVRAAQTPTP